MNKLEQALNVRDRSPEASTAAGNQIVDILLSGRTIGLLSVPELELLATGLNWAGRDKQAYEASLRSIKAKPTEVRFLHKHVIYMSNYFDSPRELIKEFKTYIREGLGPRALWWLYEAEEHLNLAYYKLEDEDWDWYEGKPVLNESELEEAARKVELAVADEPVLLLSESYLDSDVPWNVRFRPLLCHAVYEHFSRNNAA